MTEIHYHLSVVRVTNNHIFFNFLVNGNLANNGGFVCLSKKDFEKLFRDLFRSSRGNCIKSYSYNPPAEFYY